MARGLWDAATREKGGHHSQWDWDQEAFARYAELVAADGPTAALGRYQAQLWSQVLQRLPPGGAGLIVAHGGLIEPGLIAIRPTGNHRQWGGPVGHGEGARLRFDDTGTVDIRLIRLPPQP